MDTQQAFDTLSQTVAQGLETIQQDYLAHANQFDTPGVLQDAQRRRQVLDFIAHLEVLQAEWYQIETFLVPPQPEVPTPTAPQVIAPPAPDPAQPAEQLASHPGGPRHRRFRIPVLQALISLGGKETTARVVDEVGRILADQLTEQDRQVRANGDIDWRYSCRWARQDLVNEGLMRSDSPHGVWEISTQGREYIQTINQPPLLG
jgi:hypothetical protein